MNMLQELKNDLSKVPKWKLIVLGIAILATIIVTLIRPFWIWAGILVIGAIILMIKKQNQKKS